MSIESARRAEALQKQDAAIQPQIARNLADLKSQYDNAITTVRRAKLQLDEIQKFQLLRLAEMKQQQVQRQLEAIRSWENEVDRLKKEIDKY